MIVAVGWRGALRREEAVSRASLLLCWAAEGGLVSLSPPDAAMALSVEHSLGKGLGYRIPFYPRHLESIDDIEEALRRRRFVFI